LVDFHFQHVSFQVLVFSYLIKKWFNSCQRGTGNSVSSLHKFNQRALAGTNFPLNAALNSLWRKHKTSVTWEMEFGNTAVQHLFNIPCYL